MSNWMKAIALIGLTLTLNGYSAEVDKTPIKADTPEKLQAAIGEIQSEYAVGGRYEFLHPTERSEVSTLFGDMLALLQKSGSVSTMPERDRVQLFNLQERVNGLLTHSDRNRLVCERSASLGTHIQSNTCHTVAEIEHTQADAQRFMVGNQKEGDIRYAESIAPVHRGSPGH